MIDSRLLKPEEVAQYLGMSVSWVYKHVSERSEPQLPVIRLGRSLKFRQDEIERWLEQRVRRAA